MRSISGSKYSFEGLNPNRLAVLHAERELSRAVASADDNLQFERHAYAVKDRVKLRCG